MLRFADYDQRNPRFARLPRHFMNAGDERTRRVDHFRAARVQRFQRVAINSVRPNDCTRSRRHFVNAIYGMHAQRFQPRDDLRIVNHGPQCDRGRSFFSRLNRAANAEAKARVRRQSHSDRDAPSLWRPGFAPSYRNFDCSLYFASNSAESCKLFWI